MASSAAAATEPLEETQIPLEFFKYDVDDGHLAQLEDWQCCDASGNLISLDQLQYRPDLVVTGQLVALEGAKIYGFGKPKKVALKLKLSEWSIGFGARGTLNRGLWVRSDAVTAGPDAKYRWYKLGIPSSQYEPTIRQMLADVDVWTELQQVFATEQDDPTFDAAVQSLIRRNTISGAQDLLTERRFSFIKAQMARNDWSEGIFYTQFCARMGQQSPAQRKRISTAKRQLWCNEQTLM